MKAPCRHYGKCSGCTRQQFPYEKQLRDKALAVAEVLRALPARSGVGAATVAPVVASPMPYGYRTTTKLCLSEDDFGRRSVGLYERSSKKVVDIPGCLVHHELVEALVDRMVRVRAAPPAPFYNHGKRAFQPGRLKFLTIRVCPVTGEAGVVISHTGVSPEALRELAKRAEGGKATAVSVWQAELTAADGDYVIGKKTGHVAGPERARFAIGGRIHALSPLVFFQANGALTEAFVGEILGESAKAKPTGDGVLLDLYGGFGAYAAGTIDSRKSYVVDGNPQAIKDATANFKAFGLGHVKASDATVEAFLERTLPREDAAKVTRVIVNPPRGGLSPKVIAQLGDGRFPKLEELVYVSCNAETMARDIGKLTRDGDLRLARVVPFDMFPQTDHVECVARLTRKPSAPRGPRGSDGPRRPLSRDPRPARPARSRR
jgi:23S rRNA (uracil1939-C5)-methyltransferase